MAASPEMDCETSAPSEPEPKDDSIFPICTLPRELRDNIYDHMLAENSEFKLKQKFRVRISEDGLLEPHPDPAEDRSARESEEATTQENERYVSLIASVRNKPFTNAQLVSKTFQEEYLERAQRLMTLVLKDNENYSFQFVTIPEPIKEVHNVELHLILFCHSCPVMSHVDERTCQAAYEVVQHRRWIEDLLSQLTHLESLKVYTYLSHDRFKPDSKEPSPCEAIAKKKVEDLLKLSKLKQITLCAYDYTSNSKFTGPRKYLWTWPESLMEKVVEEEKKKATYKKPIVTDAEETEEEDSEMVDSKTEE